MVSVSDIGALDDSAFGPRYMRLLQALRAAAGQGRLIGGSVLASERELREAYGLSRSTVRKAVDCLVDEGLLERRKGMGIFVSDTALRRARREENRGLPPLLSFTQDMIGRGRRPHSVWLERRMAAAGSKDALALALAPGAPMHRFKCLRHADGTAIAVDHIAVPGWGLPDCDLVQTSLYAELQRFGHRPVRALQSVRASRFGADNAKLLNVSEDMPCLLVERRSFTCDGRVVEIRQSFYRGDAYDILF